MELNMLAIAVPILTVIVLTSYSLVSASLRDLPGHLKPFGNGRPTYSIEELSSFPSIKSFFLNYAEKSTPVLFKNGATHSKAFNLWDDKYFLQSVVVPADDEVNIENRKKEDRQDPPEIMHFKDFVRIYNVTNQYMVSRVPEYLRKDVLLPGPLHCPQLYEKSIVEAIMWFSSGGTKSVVHTDSVDNIICLFRGKKTFVLVDPAKFGHLVDLDFPDGAYSGVDVDRVDYEKYPGLSEVDFQIANITAGDCLYIPYKWIHQVRSSNRNIAVNVWWDHEAKFDLSQCPKGWDPELTLDKVTLNGIGQENSRAEDLREVLRDMVDRNEVLNLDKFREIISSPPEFQPIRNNADFTALLAKMLKIIDLNRNDVIEESDISALSSEHLHEANALMDEVETLAKRITMGKNEDLDIAASNKDEL